MSEITKIQAAIQKFDCTAKAWNDRILIINKKGQHIGHVNADGTLIRKMQGHKQLMGALLRDAIKAVLEEE